MKEGEKMKAYIHLLSIFLFLGAVIYFGSKDVKSALFMVTGAFIGASAVVLLNNKNFINLKK